MNATSDNAIPTADERQWAMIAHLSALLGYLVTWSWAGSAGGFIGPLVVWLAKKDRMPFVARQGREALNFAITASIVFAALFAAGHAGFRAPRFVALPFLGVAFAVLSFTILASMKAVQGLDYRYPLSLRLVR